MIQYGLGQSGELIMDSVNRAIVDQDSLARVLFMKMRELVKAERTKATQEERLIDSATFWIGRSADAAACYNQIADRLVVLEGEHLNALRNSQTPFERRDEMRRDLLQSGRRGLFKRVKDFLI